MGKKFQWWTLYESTGENWMINRLKKVLDSKQLYGYKIINNHTHRYDLYFIKQELDMNRYVDTNEYELTIYKEFADNKLGIASAMFDESMDIDEIEEKIEELIFNATYATNKKFDLVKKANFKNVVKDVNFHKESLKEAAFMIADAIFDTDKYDKGFVNSCEIFVYFKETNLYTSTGIEYTYCRQYAEIELITSWIDKQDVELYKFLEIDSLDSNYLNMEINKMFLDCKNRSNAIPTIEIKNAKVMLTELALKQFFEFFINKTNASTIYNKMSDYYVDKKIINSIKGEKFTIQALEKLENSTNNTPFDSDGIILKSRTLIEDGIVKNLWGTQQYCQYLSTKATGEYYNFVVSCGNSKQEEIKFDYLEIVSLSGLEIDPLTGDFGSEIRFAYYHNKNKIKYFTGGTITGNIYKSLPSLMISAEEYHQNNFWGPKYIIIDNVNVAKK